MEFKGGSSGVRSQGLCWRFGEGEFQGCQARTAEILAGICMAAVEVQSGREIQEICGKESGKDFPGSDLRG